MNAETRATINHYIEARVERFHARRLASIRGLTLRGVLENKNPYLFRAKNLTRAADLITALLDARLSSGEETSFGGFLEDLALYVAQHTGGGQKSSTTGFDIDLEREGVRYLIAVKSGPNWGNSSQKAKLRENFRTAVKVIRQSGVAGPQLQPVEGICYGKFGKPNPGMKDHGDYISLAGQSFWQLISGDREFYVEIIEPLARSAEAAAEQFQGEKDGTYNRLTLEFTETFCDPPDYQIDWPKLLRYVSETLPPPEHPPMFAWLEQFEQEQAAATANDEDKDKES